MQTIIYTAHDLKQIVSTVGINTFMDEAIACIEEVMAGYRPKDYQIPVRDGFEYQHPHLGLIEWMPTFQVGGDIILKVVGYHPKNPLTHQVPSVLSTSLHLDTQTGHMCGVMDSTFTTAVRTGAASAITSKVLASSDSQCLGLIGCGAQSITQLHAISRIFSLSKVYIYDVDERVCDSFVARIEGLELSHVNIEKVSLQTLVSHADILCTTTSVDVGGGPVFDDVNLQSHLHINAVGSDFPGKVEVPKTVLHRALVCPDFKLQAVNEGECQQLTEEQIGPDIVELVQNMSKFTDFKQQVTVFDSTGWALKDFAMAKLISRYAEELGCGTRVDMACVDEDCKNPYGFMTCDSSAQQQRIKIVG